MGHSKAGIKKEQHGKLRIVSSRGWVEVSVLAM
jgi:hypothetical protein